MVIKPIRTQTGSIQSYNPLYYNTSTGEVVNSTSIKATSILTENFVVAGGQGANPLAYSYDGIAWQSGTSNLTNSGKLFADGSCNAVGFNGTSWVAGGQGEAALAYSSDGITWTTNVAGITGAAAPNTVLDSGTWRTAVPLTGPTNANGFGSSVAINNIGTRFAVGSPYYNQPSSNTGAVYIQDYSLAADTWATSATINSPTAGVKFGTSIGLNAAGNRMVVGAPTAGPSSFGGFYDVSFNNDGTWTTPVLYAPSSGPVSQANIGSAIAMNPSGTKLLIGSPGNDGSRGSVYYYTYAGGTWTTASTGNTSPYVLKGTTNIANYLFGTSIAYATNSSTGLQRCLIGEPRTSIGSQGYVYSFDFSNNSSYWGVTTVSGTNAVPDQSIFFRSIAYSDSFGSAVAMDASGVTAAIGAPYTTNPTTNNTLAGAVYIYKHNGLAWGLYASLYGSGAANEYFGTSVALNGAGNRLVVGAGVSTTGKTYVFNYSALTLQWVPETPAFTGAANDNMGACVAISAYGNRFISGAPTFTPTTTVGKVYIYDRQMNATAVSWNGSVWNAGGNGTSLTSNTLQPNLLAYSTDGVNWQNNSLITGASNTLTQTFIGLGGTNRYYAYATAMNAAGTRLAVLSSGDGTTANNTVTCAIYDISYNGVWPLTPTWTSGNIGYVKYMQQMTNWGQSPGTNNYVNMGCTPLAMNAAGDRIAIGVNAGTGGVGNTGFVNIYHYNYTTNTWPAGASPTKQYSKATGYAGSIYDWFGTSVAFNAMGTRIFISSVYNNFISTTSYINIYDGPPSQTGTWPANAASIQLYDGNYNTLNPVAPSWTLYGAAIATNAAGNRLIVGAPTIIYYQYFGYVYLYHLTASGWVNTPVRIYTMDSLSGSYTAGTFGASVSMNAAGDRIAIGEPTEIIGTAGGQAGLTSQGRAYVIDYDYTANRWPGPGTGAQVFAKDAASVWYVGCAGTPNSNFFGTCVALNAAGDRLLITQPYNSIYDPTNLHFGVTFVLDYNYATQSWPSNYALSNYTNNGQVINGLEGLPGFTYILGTKGQCLGNSVAINADGTVFALGSNQAATYAGVLNLYNYKTKLALTAVNALASNGALTVAGGVGTTNIFATSTDGITFSNSVNDASGVLLNGTVATTNTGAALISIIENPNNTTGNFFGGNNNGEANPGSVTLNAAGTLMAVGAQGTNSSVGAVYIYASTLYGPWRLIQTLSGYAVSSFGACVAFNATGSLLAVGAYSYVSAETAGAVYMFQANSTFTQWSLLPTVFGAPVGGGLFGVSLVINAVGNVLVVGAKGYPADVNLAYGRAHIYRACPAFTNWSIELTLDNPNGSKNDGFGNAVAVNAAGTIMAAGAYAFTDIPPVNTGKVYIYGYNNGAWSLFRGIVNPSGTRDELFSNSVALNAAGNILAIGAYAFSNFQGKVYVYTTTNNWATVSSVSITVVGGVSNQYFGSGLALNAAGNILLTTAVQFNTGGRVFVYTTTNNWATAPTPTTIDASGNCFGNNLAINAAGTVLACGASNYNTNTGRMYTYTFNAPSALATRTCKALATNGQLWVAGGPSTQNPLAWSTDAQTWYPSTNGTASFPFSNQQCNALAWNGSKWVAGGLGSNPLAYSYDGQNWWQSLNGPTIFPSGIVNAVTWNATYWLASGTGTAGNTQAYSTDGIIWQVDQNNSSATLFSGNTGLAVAARKSGGSTQIDNLAIGNSAGNSNQPSNSIILNATGNILSANYSTASAFYVAPVRAKTTASSGILEYNTTSNEITYNTSQTVANIYAYFNRTWSLLTSNATLGNNVAFAYTNTRMYPVDMVMSVQFSSSDVSNYYYSMDIITPNFTISNSLPFDYLSQNLPSYQTLNYTVGIRETVNVVYVYSGIFSFSWKVYVLS